MQSRLHYIFRERKPCGLSRQEVAKILIDLRIFTSNLCASRQITANKVESMRFRPLKILSPSGHRWQVIGLRGSRLMVGRVLSALHWTNAALWKPAFHEAKKILEKPHELVLLRTIEIWLRIPWQCPLLCFSSSFGLHSCIFTVSIHQWPINLEVIPFVNRTI